MKSSCLGLLALALALPPLLHAWTLPHPTNCEHHLYNATHLCTHPPTPHL